MSPWEFKEREQRIWEINVSDWHCNCGFFL